MQILVDSEKCDGCGLCIDLCPADAPVLELIDNIAAAVHVENCLECQACAVNCESHAITYIDD